jgi:Uma2 family endonuclease
MSIEEALRSEEQELNTEIASGLHAVIGANLDWYLSAFVRPNKLGRVLNSSATYNFKDGLPKRQPDVSFVSFEKMPVPVDDELIFAPELAVEVVSKNDIAYEIEAKVKQYQDAGVRLIWVIYPFSRTASIYRLNRGLISQTLGPDDELDGENVIPGFRVKISALFE